jgi:pimeloyl-ACP methyl ester carboxylesterase
MRSHLMYPALALAALTSTVMADAQPIRVFVTRVEAPAPPKPTEADRQAASAAYDVADKARKALEKTLKAQHGNKRDKWPAEAQASLADAEEARDRANADWQYRVDAEPLDKFWASDIDQALTQSGLTGRKEHITSVASENEAQLIVTLTGVRNPMAVINAAADRCLTFLVARGPKVSAEQFARLPRVYRPRRAQAKRLNGPSESAPFWRFEGCGLHPYFREPEAIANIVNDFAGAHLALLTGSAGQ